jgi:hypothetical protein
MVIFSLPVDIATSLGPMAAAAVAVAMAASTARRLTPRSEPGLDSMEELSALHGNNTSSSIKP